VLDRFFKGLHVEEADAPLIVVADATDAKNATPGDPTFIVGSAARQGLVRFDQTGEFPPGGFTLRPPTPAQTLEGERLTSLKWRTSNPQSSKATPQKDPLHAALIVGESRGSASRRHDVLSLQGVRHGTGMVHFTPASADEPNPGGK
jgi:hypothetical protein